MRKSLTNGSRVLIAAVKVNLKSIFLFLGVFVFWWLKKNYETRLIRRFI